MPRHRLARYRACLGRTASKSACHCGTWRSEGVRVLPLCWARTCTETLLAAARRRGCWLRVLARLHGDGFPCLQLAQISISRSGRVAGTKK